MSKPTHDERLEASKRFNKERILRQAENGTLDMTVTPKYISNMGSDQNNYVLHFKPNNSPIPFYDERITVDRFDPETRMHHEDIAHDTARLHLENIKTEIESHLGPKIVQYKITISKKGEKNPTLKVEKK